MKPQSETELEHSDMRENYINLLVLIQSFLLLWLRHYFSDGAYAYDKHTKNSAQVLVDFFRKVAKQDSNLYSTKGITLNDKDDTESIPSILNSLESWSKEDKKVLCFEGIKDKEQVNYYLKRILACCSGYLINKIGLKVPPVLVESSLDGALHQNYVTWIGHVHCSAIKMMENLHLYSEQESIVLVADIRQSQDLITYSPSSDFFRDNLTALIEKSRSIVADNYGIFDRVTGDGFICYFSKLLCYQMGKDYYTCAVDTCRAIVEYANDLFPRWTAQLRKIPSQNIGLVIGLDAGIVNYSINEGQLFAFSEASVWATRMCNAGCAGDVILNNIPYRILSNTFPTLGFEELSGSTKSGESFKAYKLLFDSYNPKQLDAAIEQDKES